MTAADAREELEAVIWPRVTPGRHEHGKDASRRAVDAILTAADAYAEAAREDGYRNGVAQVGHARRHP